MRKLMKKMITLGLVMAMVMTTGMVAAASPTNKYEVSGVDAGGNAVNVVITPEKEHFLSKEDAVKLLPTTLVDVPTENLRLISFRAAVDENALFPLQIDVIVPGVRAETKVGVLHFDKEKQEWEEFASTSSTDLVSFVATGFSPILIAIDSTGMDGVLGSTATSPKTADNYTVFYVIGLLLIACLGLVLGKKKN